MVLDQNLFVETVLPGAVQRQLSNKEPKHYREPSAIPAKTGGRPLSWPRSIPIDGEPADVVAVVNDYGKCLAKSECQSRSSTANRRSCGVGFAISSAAGRARAQSPFPQGISSRRTAQMRSARQCAVGVREGAHTASRSLSGPSLENQVERSLRSTSEPREAAIVHHHLRQPLFTCLRAECRSLLRE